MRNGSENSERSSKILTAEDAKKTALISASSVVSFPIFLLSYQSCVQPIGVIKHIGAVGVVDYQFQLASAANIH